MAALLELIAKEFIVPAPVIFFYDQRGNFYGALEPLRVRIVSELRRTLIWQPIKRVNLRPEMKEALLLCFSPLDLRTQI